MLGVTVTAEARKNWRRHEDGTTLGSSVPGLLEGSNMESPSSYKNRPRLRDPRIAPVAEFHGPRKANLSVMVDFYINIDIDMCLYIYTHIHIHIFHIHIYIYTYRNTSERSLTELLCQVDLLEI